MRYITLFVALFGLAGCDIGSAQRHAEHTLSVQGTGTVAVQPDVAVVRVGVDTREATSQETLNKNSQVTNAIIDAVKTLGVAEQHIQTEALQLHPRYEHQRDDRGRSTQHLVGYRASNIVSIRLLDLGRAGDMIDAASQAGANRIDSIRFEVSEPARALEQARQAAWADALAQAQQLAALAGVQLGQVSHMATHNALAPQVQEMTMARSAMAMDAPPIAGGQQQITVHLQVTWQLADQ